MNYVDKDQMINVVVSSDSELNSSEQIEIHQDCNYMAQLMTRTGCAISAGGSTINELAIMQVPTLLVIVADNQENHARWAKKNGLNIVIDARLADKNDVAEEIARSAMEIFNDIELKTRICVKSKLFVGGDGVTKVAAKISGLFSTT